MNNTIYFSYFVFFVLLPLRVFTSLCSPLLSLIAVYLLVTVSHFIILVVDIATLFSISIFPTTRLPNPPAVWPARCLSLFYLPAS